MRYFLTLFTISITLQFSVFSQNREIIFETITLEQAKQKAASEGKLIFIDCYTTWCGPCKYLAKNIFTKDDVAELFNSNFINIKIDMEKEEGVELGKKYGGAVPTLLVFNSKGEMVDLTVGVSTDAQKGLIEFGKRALSGINTYSSYSKRYEAGDRSATVMLKMIELANHTSKPAQGYVDEFFRGVKLEDLAVKDNWMMFYLNQHDFRSEQYQYIQKNWSTYVEKFGLDSLKKKYLNDVKRDVRHAMRKNTFTKQDLDQLQTEYKTLKLPFMDEILFKSGYLWVQHENDKEKFRSFVFKKGNQSYFTTEEINGLCWNAFEEEENIEHLKIAAQWMKEMTSVQANHNWMYLDTYASLLFKLKQKKEAEKIATEAISLAQSTGVAQADYKVTVELLEKIKALN